MSLQECLARRKDCSGKGRVLNLAEIQNICKSTHQAISSKTLFVVLPEGADYEAGIYTYNEKGLNLLTSKAKTKYTMELYPELIRKEPLELTDLIDLGLAWQYLSLKAESIGLGVSQRARGPKGINKQVNKATNTVHQFLYSVAVRERDRAGLIEDTREPLSIQPEEGTIILNTPVCYKNRAIYEKKYKGTPIDSAIYDRVEKKAPDYSSLYELSQLLWACQGENDHATHGNRDGLEKNGYGRVHATGCAGYAVYPLVLVEELANLPKGAYWYNPVGFSGLNRWLSVEGEKKYDHLLHQFSTDNSTSSLLDEFKLNVSHFAIILCIDRKKPCAGFAHSKIGKLVMNTKYWAEVEAGMALAGLQLQANALGLKWKKVVFPNPDYPKYRNTFNLELLEQSINQRGTSIMNRAKNEKLSLKGHLIPTVLFSI